MEPQEILPYMSALFEALLLVLQGGSHRVQEMALSAMSSIAAAAGKSLQPYAGELGRGLVERLTVETQVLDVCWLSQACC
jgi:hypothetical protein